MKNVATRQWREAINALLMHQEIKPELYKEISKLVSLEFDEYLKSGCILQARNPDELASFSNRIFMKEVRIFCPLWFDCVRGATGLSQNAFKECGQEINSSDQEINFSDSNASTLKKRQSLCSALPNFNHNVSQWC